MADRLDDSAPFDDDQGTRISRNPAGAGSEATSGTEAEAKNAGPEHRSESGGDKGEPKERNDPDIPTSRR